MSCLIILCFVLWIYLLNLFCCMFFVMNISFEWFRYVKREHLIDVTEVFRVLSVEKKFRIAKLALYLIVLIVTIFRFVILKNICLPAMLWLVQSKCSPLYPFYFLIEGCEVEEDKFFLNVLEWFLLDSVYILFIHS